MERIQGMCLLELLNPQQDEHILDVGCEKGELTKKIAIKAAKVVGIDNKNFYREWKKVKSDSSGNLKFQKREATNLKFKEKFDAVFSHLVIHHIKTPEEVISSVWNALKPDGRFVAEFYGNGTGEEVRSALQEVMTDSDYSFNVNEDFPWYLPTQEQYCKLLENKGFEVSSASILLEERGLGYENIVDWLTKIKTNTQNLAHINEEIFKKVQNKVRSKLFKDNTWFVNYQHIIIVARKKSRLSNNN